MVKNNIKNKHLTKIPKIEIAHGRIEYILDICRDKNVLHLGCVDEGLTKERIKEGRLLHLKIMKVAKKVWGVDISENGIKVLKDLGINNLIVGDVEKNDVINKIKGQKFDIIIAAEIIEHLSNPGLFLNSIKGLFVKETRMVLTTPSAFRFTGFKYAIKGYEYVHPDHNCWFSLSTLAVLLSKNGYRIDKVLAYSMSNWEFGIFDKIKNIKKEKYGGPLNNNQTEIKPYNRWSVFRLFGVWLRGRLYKRNPLFADGIICIVRPN